MLVSCNTVCLFWVDEIGLASKSGYYADVNKLWGSCLLLCYSRAMKRFPCCIDRLVGLLSFVLSAFLWLLVAFLLVHVSLPDVDVLKHPHGFVSRPRYDSYGDKVGFYGSKWRSPVVFKQIPSNVINGVVATEDSRFFRHPGVDIIGVVRAAKVVLSTGKKKQGASTITMQLARNYFLTHKKTFKRKFIEVLIAFKLEHVFSKRRILELYLNKIYFGCQSYGVEAASWRYYGKPLARLNLAQAAMMAGLPQAPSRNNPVVNPLGALHRRNHVLHRMLLEHYISSKGYLAARRQPVTAVYHR